jgi:proteasome lid subunit RPN8/RPN11
MWRGVESAERRVERGPMRRRTDVDETLQAVRMSGRLLNELCKHAVDTQPEECCGLIVGDRVDRYQRLVPCRNDMTQRNQRDPVAYPRDGHEAYWMNEHDYQRAIEDAEAEGLEVTAVYHSHVGGEVYLSEMDLAYAESESFPFPDAEQIVISVSQEPERGLAQVRAVGIFQREGRDLPFVGRSVLPLVP